MCTLIQGEMNYQQIAFQQAVNFRIDLRRQGFIFRAETLLSLRMKYLRGLYDYYSDAIPRVDRSPLRRDQKVWFYNQRCPAVVARCATVVR
jgi:hypothetical protein